MDKNDKAKLMVTISLMGILVFGTYGFIEFEAVGLMETIWGWLYVAVMIILTVVCGCILNVLQEEEG